MRTVDSNLEVHKVSCYPQTMPRQRKKTRRLLDWSIFRKMGIVAFLVLGIFQFQSPLTTSQTDSNVLGISDYFSFFRTQPTLTAMPTQKPLCGAPGQGCCEGNICSGNLSNGKESACVFWQKDTNDANSVDYVCALPQLMTDIAPDATNAGVVTIKLYTNAASAPSVPSPYTFYVECQSTVPSSTVSPSQFPDQEVPTSLSVSNDKPYGEIRCAYPSIPTDAAYTIRAWARIVQANKTEMIDPIFKSVLVGAYQSFVNVNP